MPDTNNPRPSAMIAAERAEAQALTARLEAEERLARQQEAERAEREAEKKRSAEALAAALNKKRDSLWAAPLPKTFRAFSQVTTSLHAAVSEYTQAADQLGLRSHEQDRVINAHPMMRLLPWLRTFGGQAGSDR